MANFTPLILSWELFREILRDIKQSPQLVASENEKNTTLFDKVHRLFSSLYYSLLTFLKNGRKNLAKQ